MNAHRAISVHYVAVVLIAMLGLTTVLAQNAPNDGDWEYLIVSYGETYFSDPFANPQRPGSKVILFSELGINLPQEATTTQRNIDVLGRFGWELVDVVGSIGGDQQWVFKRPYDDERSSNEGDAIAAEREALLEMYEEDADEPTTTTDDGPALVDLDAVEERQALEARNARDHDYVDTNLRNIADGIAPVVNLEIDVKRGASDQDADVTANLTLDITDQAMVDENAYRTSLAQEPLNVYRESLNASFLDPEYTVCRDSNELTVHVIGVVQHNGETHRVAHDYNYGASGRCFNSPTN